MKNAPIFSDSDYAAFFKATKEINKYLHHIKEYDQELYYQLVYFPAEIIWSFDNVLKNLYKKYFIEGKRDDLSED